MAAGAILANLVPTLLGSVLGGGSEPTQINVNSANNLAAVTSTTNLVTIDGDVDATGEATTDLSADGELLNSSTPAEQQAGLLGGLSGLPDGDIASLDVQQAGFASGGLGRTLGVLMAVGAVGYFGYTYVSSK